MFYLGRVLIDRQSRQPLLGGLRHRIIISVKPWTVLLRSFSKCVAKPITPFLEKKANRGFEDVNVVDILI